MWKATLLILVVIVPGSITGPSVSVSNCKLIRKGNTNQCSQTGKRAAECRAECGEQVQLNCDWNVYGGDPQESTSLVAMTVKLSWSGSKSRKNYAYQEVPACQKTGGHIVLGDKSKCSVFDVANGTYPQDNLQQTVPKPSKCKDLRLTITADTKWLDKTYRSNDLLFVIYIRV